MLKTVLIDIDNTLLDFDRCAEASIRQAMAEWGLPWGAEVYPTFRRVNDILWREIEKGNLSRAGLQAIRFPWIFDKLGIDADGKRFEERFVALLWDSHETVDGAAALLEHLSGRYAVYAASNAPAGEQENRLRLAGLLPYFRGIFVSQEMGAAAKPSREFFDACFARLGNPPKDQVLLIGDSLTADMQGAVDYGIRACWFNHDHASRDIALPVEHIAERLEEIKGWY